MSKTKKYKISNEEKRLFASSVAKNVIGKSDSVDASELAKLYFCSFQTALNEIADLSREYEDSL